MCIVVVHLDRVCTLLLFILIECMRCPSLVLCAHLDQVCALSLSGSLLFILIECVHCLSPVLCVHLDRVCVLLLFILIDMSVDSLLFFVHLNRVCVVVRFLIFLFEGLKRLSEGFQGENNPNLCGFGFVSVRNCTVFDTENIKGAGFQPFLSEPNKNKPESADFHNASCYQLHCSKPTTVPRIAIVSAVLIVSMTLLLSVILTVFWYRHRKQVGSSSVSCDNRLGSDQARECYSKSASPLVCLEYSHGWDSLADGIKGLGLSKFFSKFIFNIEEVESATQYFSEANLLGRSSFSMVYKGVLKDGSSVAIRSVHMTSCKSDEAEFLRGLNLLSSLRHENLVSLRGFCCSRGRGEFFLVYDFASRGSLSRYLDVGDGSSHVLDWSKRISIINGIAKGLLLCFPPLLFIVKASTSIH